LYHKSSKPLRNVFLCSYSMSIFMISSELSDFWYSIMRTTLAVTNCNLLLVRIQNTPLIIVAFEKNAWMTTWQGILCNSTFSSSLQGICTVTSYKALDLRWGTWNECTVSYFGWTHQLNNCLLIIFSCSFYQRHYGWFASCLNLHPASYLSYNLFGWVTLYNS